MLSNRGASAGESIRKTVKITAIYTCLLMIVMMMWEGQKSDAAVAAGPIPEESIRLRILANSDSPRDQLVKRQIRDEIVQQMNLWVAELENPQSLEQARTLIRAQLPELESLVGRELRERGEDYSYRVELGTVPFPAKLYGGTVYPAGEYEALRVTLGEGKGQNWWCVLFPPLCFIDAGTGEAAAASAETAGGEDASAAGKAKAAAGQAKATGAGKVQQTSAEGGSGGAAAGAADSGETETGGEAPEVRFFLWELIEGIGEWLRSLWS